MTEAGCDEAGRGCIAGPVFAAAVVFPPGYTHPDINDSKQMTPSSRDSLRQIILRDAVAWAVEMVDAEEIDRINILRASILAFHKALEKLTPRPELILVDGNRFKPFRNIPYHCIIRGDATFLSIAAASILAKTFRDDLMISLHHKYPQYDWLHNKGYPSAKHRKAVETEGLSPFHRRSFKPCNQITMDLRIPEP